LLLRTLRIVKLMQLPISESQILSSIKITFKEYMNAYPLDHVLIYIRWLVIQSFYNILSTGEIM